MYVDQLVRYARIAKNAKFVNKAISYIQTKHVQLNLAHQTVVYVRLLPNVRLVH